MESPGVISANEAYTRSETMRRLACGAQALRNMEAEGLRSVTRGRQKFYIGRDIIAYLDGLDGGPESSVGN